MDAQRRIKELMEERKWTDYRLAKESNLSHSTVTNMFNRNNAPTLPTLEAVCRAFGITLAQPLLCLLPFYNERISESVRYFPLALLPTGAEHSHTRIADGRLLLSSRCSN